MQRYDAHQSLSVDRLKSVFLSFQVPHRSTLGSEPQPRWPDLAKEEQDIHRAVLRSFLISKTQNLKIPAQVEENWNEEGTKNVMKEPIEVQKVEENKQNYSVFKGLFFNLNQTSSKPMAITQPL